MWTTTCSPPFDPRGDKPGFDRALVQFAIAALCLIVFWLLIRGCGSAVHAPEYQDPRFPGNIAVVSEPSIHHA